jgi:hypothetical protein
VLPIPPSQNGLLSIRAVFIVAAELLKPAGPLRQSVLKGHRFDQYDRSHPSRGELDVMGLREEGCSAPPSEVLGVTCDLSVDALHGAIILSPYGKIYWFNLPIRRHEDPGAAAARTRRGG